MKLTNAEVNVAMRGLAELLNEKLPAKAAFKVRTLHKALATSWETVVEVQKTMIQEYADKDESGALKKVQTEKGEEGASFTDENAAKFQAAWDELMATEVEITQSLSLSDLGDKEITPVLAIALGDLLVDA